jgi:protein-disulfide isomerase
MCSFLNSICLLLLAASLATAQTPAQAPAKTTPAKPPEKLGTHATPDLPSEATVDSFLHQTFGYQPDLTWKISSIAPSPVEGLAEVTVVLASPQGQQLTRFYVAPDGQHALVGDIIPFGARPFDPAKTLLEKGITGPSRGPKDAAVTIVEFGDLQCPACKAAQPTIEALVAAEPNTRFVFQNFPLEMHNWAAKGAAYADCVGRASNDAFWKFVAKTYETQSDITAENADEKLTAIADGAGVKGADIAACAVKPETKAHVDASLALGKSVDVSGTPTLYINGRKIGSFDQRNADLYKALVEFAAKDAK